MRRLRRHQRLGLLALACQLTACGYTRFTHIPGGQPPPAQGESEPDAALRLHVFGGDLFVLDEWAYDPGTDLLYGQGLRLNDLRREVARGELMLPYALVTRADLTQDLTYVPGYVPLLVVAIGGAVIITLACGLSADGCLD